MRQTSHCAVQRAILLAVLAAAPLSCAHDYTGPAPAVANVDVDGVSFRDGVDTASVTLRNTGGSPLHWRIGNPIAWLSAPDSGTVPPSGAVQLLLHADAAPMPAGDHSGSFTVRANHFGPDITIQVHLQVPVAPAAILVRADTLEHPLDIGQVVISNSGKGDLNWSARSTATWLMIEQEVSGATAPAATSNISFRIDRDATPKDTTAHIVIESDDADSPLLVPVRVRGIPPPEYMALPGPAVDALGGFFSGVQVLTGSTLSVISPLERTITAMALPRAGISLAQMLGRTVVAHDSGFSIVDVSTRTVERFVPVDFEVQSMAAVGGFVFLVPKSASRAHLVSIRYSDPDRRELIVDQPPLHDIVAVGSYVYGGYDGGILRYDTWDPVTHAPVLIANWTGIPFAPDRIEMWLRDLRLITSSGAVVHIGSGAVATLTLPGGAAIPPIRHARDDWAVWRIVHESQGQPPSEHVWDYDAETLIPTAIVLPDVEVTGQMVPAAAHFYLGEELRSRLIIQQAVTPDGQGPWSLLRLYH